MYGNDTGTTAWNDKDDASNEMSWYFSDRLLPRMFASY